MPPIWKYPAEQVPYKPPGDVGSIFFFRCNCGEAFVVGETESGDRRIIELEDTGRSKRPVVWYDSGPFDIGLMTADAIREYGDGTAWRDAGREVWHRRAEGSNAGNGSVMRCAPHAIAFAEDLDTLIQVSKESSAITHYDPRCTYGCAVLNCTIAGYLRDVEDPLEMALDQVQRDAPDELVESLRFVPDMIDEPQLKTSGYVVHTL